MLKNKQQLILCTTKENRKGGDVVEVGVVAGVVVETGEAGDATVKTLI